MERNQAETNRRLENMQSMLQEVMATISSAKSSDVHNPVPTNTPSVGENIGSKQHGDFSDRDSPPEKDRSEQWWDSLGVGSGGDGEEDLVC